MRLLPDLQDYIVPFPHKGAELAEDNPHERAGPIEELCRWTVDLSPLPAFQQNAQLAREGKPEAGIKGSTQNLRSGWSSTAPKSSVCSFLLHALF